MSEFMITREIGIDMGHRVTHHGSKCKNIHGHRYTILATCAGKLFDSGEQEGMVLDFGFLKDIMMAEIDAPCDHGMCLWVDDPIASSVMSDLDYSVVQTQVLRDGHLMMHTPIFGKLYLVPFVPTAENLAKHWYERMKLRVAEITQGLGWLESVTVYETPNCSAMYPR